ncbi:MAG: hypothetical protein HYU41_17395 [Candidatus Rokubacteria bacterium]|nr:hypothetical protein [Candidatus Rokubacteria bacterium]
MARLYLVSDGAELARRRAKLGAGQFAEAWPDLFARDRFWIGEESKAVLDGGGPPLPAELSLDGARVPVYYGPRLADLDSLPREESVQTRVLSAHGVAAAWITLGRTGQRTTHTASSPEDPVFFLRRPRGAVSHVWRLFRTRAEARAFMAEEFDDDAGAATWVQTLHAEDFDELLARYGERG